MVLKGLRGAESFLRHVQRRENERFVLPERCLSHGQGLRESCIPNEPFSRPAEHISKAPPRDGEDVSQGRCCSVPSDAAPALAPVVSRDGHLCVKRGHLFFMNSLRVTSRKGRRWKENIFRSLSWARGR